MDELTRLLLAAREGDRLALGAFIRRTQGEVWRFCAHLAGREAADDLTQETFLRAWTALPSWRAEASARTWLLVLARRACVDALRSQRRRRLLSLAIPAPTSEPDPAGGVELERLLAGLEPGQRAAFVLTQVLGVSYAEAAGVCGCPVGTIRSRVARARAQLIAQLSPDSALI